MLETKMELAGPAGSLEARLVNPRGNPRLTAVVAHPHPLYGGTMDNAVVVSATQELVGLGAATLRFNFRGVESSGGSHDGGNGEVEDLATAEASMRELHPGLPLWVVGYSFGSVMALRRLECGATSARAVTLLAPPVPRYDFSSLERCQVPLGLIVGSADEIAPAEQVTALASTWPTEVHTEVLEPAGHDLGTRISTTPLRAALARTFEALAAETALP